MWSVKSIRSSETPRFLEIEFLWQGQQREGKLLGTALSNLSMTVTVWAEEGGGVEIASWWDVPWWARRCSRLVFHLSNDFGFVHENHSDFT